MIKSAYTREDYDRFDENGKYIPYKPTEEELAKKDEIKKVLEQRLSDAYEPDPMDDYAGYDSTDARIDMACERVAKQFGVDTDFVEEIAGEIQYEEYTGLMPEDEWIYKHYDDKHKFWDWQNSELDVKPLIKKDGWIVSKRAIKSSPNFKKFTADEIFDFFQMEELIHTVFMDREECKNAKCGMNEFSDLMYDVLPGYLGVYTADDVREVCRRAKNPKAKAFLEAFETALENAKFVDKFYNSIKVHKKTASSRKPVKSDAASEQKLKEDLIRQGYTEEEATQIVTQRKPEEDQQTAGEESQWGM